VNTAVLAAVAMVIQDLLAVLLVQAESRDRAVLSGVLDSLMWPAGMVTTAISVTALQGHHTGLKAEVFAAVTVANFAGSAAAVWIGKRVIKAPPCGCPCMVAAAKGGETL
jgi:hypothetical protein